MSYDMLSHVKPHPKKVHTWITRFNILKLRYRSIITLVTLIMGTSTFGQFIIEEALQNYGFGVGSFLFGNTYKSAPEESLLALKEYTIFHNSCQKVMNLLYLGNPISAIWFQLFMQSNLKKIKHWTNIATKYYSEKKDSLTVSYEYPFEGGKVILFEHIR